MVRGSRSGRERGRGLGAFRVLRAARTPGRGKGSNRFPGCRRPPVRRPDRTLRWGVGCFVDDEGGYTSVAAAVALLVCLALTFSLVQVGWTGSRAARCQTVADAAALSGARAVRAYSTVAQVMDATVLTLGLCGLVTLGAGLVTSLVPGMGTAGLKVCDVGRRVLDGRRELAHSAATGLEALEAALPAAVASNAWATVEANDGGAVNYAGAALAFPAESKSVFGTPDDVDGADVAAKAQEAAQASDECKEAVEARDEALERGWHADCVDDPSCLSSRAGSLAGLAGADNPVYPHPEGWNFGVPLARARAYYAARLASEAPATGSLDAKVDSALRRAYYAYALDQVQKGHYREGADGSVSVDLPELAHDAETTRASPLYTEALWPCSDEGGTQRIHAVAECPGATGDPAGEATVAAAEAARWERCPDCGLDLSSLGRVASASTNIPNGFEHYWRKIVEASRDWEREARRAQEAEDELKDVGQEGADLFEQAIGLLAVERPRLCPPGAYGCIAVVAGSGGQGPANPFTGSATVPPTAAVAGACLAPDNGAQNTVLARFFDGVTQGEEGGVAGLAQGLCSLWGDLLGAYGDAYGAVGDTAKRFFDGLDAVGLGGVGRWLGDKLSAVVVAAGFEPVDMRLRKPVLCNSQQILDADGSGGVATLRTAIQSMPENPTATQVLAAFGRTALDRLGEREIDLGELSIPGTPLKIPLKVRLSTLLGAGS